MTLDEFEEEINTLNTEFKPRDLEEYLLAVYKNIEDNKKVYLREKATLNAILCILKDCFTSPAAPFNDEWLAITEAPDDNRMNRKFTNSDIEDAFDKTNTSSLHGLDFTTEVLKFQIAELHRMRGKQLDDEYRYFGIASETGNHWYNFDPFSILSCGTACMIDNEEEMESIDWSFVGDLLEDGRIYE